MTDQAQQPVEVKLTLAERLEELTGLTKEQINALPCVTGFRDMSGASWRYGDPSPVTPELKVFALYNDSVTGDVRVYTLPQSARDAKGRPLMPTRFTLNRRAASLLIEQMVSETWEEELASEIIEQFEELAGDDEEEEEEGPEGAEVPAAADSAVPAQAPVTT